MPAELKKKTGGKNGGANKEPAPIVGKPAPVIAPDALKLEAHNLVKTYGKRTVVRGVSFNVRQGEVVGILGPNGAGKTTSFYMTIGLVKQSGGQVFLGGEDLSNLRMYMRARKGIGYLAQEASIFRTLSVRKNIEAILELRGFSRADMAARADELLKELEIEHVQHQNGITLSGGERRRAEIARALASDPKFLLLDEPFAGVDPIAVKEIQRVVWQLQDRGLGILITDHNVRETLKLTDRSYIIFQGQVLIEGTADVLIKDKKAREIYLGDDFKI
jgi:lipopolysaccharide export system ATP-binding protein